MTPFNVARPVGRELEFIEAALRSGRLSGDGPFTKKCHAWLQEHLGRPSLLTHSCTAALEMAMLLAGLEPGDEVILPSFTFVSTANAVALRRAVPVFVDVRPDTLNIDERLVEEAITERTRAIIAVHYAGVIAEMDALADIANRHGLYLVEDAAQALLSTYKGRDAGALGDAAAFSFHETKNVVSGEGGALIVKQESDFRRAEILREKGTNRSQFYRGAVDKYTWVDLGSSYLPGELVAAFLYAQLERAKEITEYRRDVCVTYFEAFAEFQAKGHLKLPCVPPHCTSNGHMFYLMLEGIDQRTAFIEAMNRSGVMTAFHYVPLHSSPAGLRLGRVGSRMSVTDVASERLVRLPVYWGVKDEQERVIDAALAVLRSIT